MLPVWGHCLTKPQDSSRVCHISDGIWYIKNQVIPVAAACIRSLLSITVCLSFKFYSVKQQLLNIYPKNMFWVHLVMLRWLQRWENECIWGQFLDIFYLFYLFYIVGIKRLLPIVWWKKNNNICLWSKPMSNPVQSKKNFCSNKFLYFHFSPNEHPVKNIPCVLRIYKWKMWIHVCLKIRCFTWKQGSLSRSFHD